MPAALGGFVLAAVIVTLLCSELHYDVMRIYEARDRLREGGLLVDVDGRGDFAQRHPRLAINIPLQELARRTEELGSLDSAAAARVEALHARGEATRGPRETVELAPQPS